MRRRAYTQEEIKELLDVILKLQKYKDILSDYRQEILKMPITNIEQKINNLISAFASLIADLGKYDFNTAFDHFLAIIELLNVIIIDFRRTLQVMSNNHIYQDLMSMTRLLPPIGHFIEEKMRAVA